MSVYATGSQLGCMIMSICIDAVAGGDVLLSNAAWQDSECADSNAQPRKLLADSLAAERAYLGQSRPCAPWLVNALQTSLWQTETYSETPGS